MPVYEYIIENEIEIRLSFFFGILLLMALWEFIAPRRRLKLSRLVRWSNNLGIVLLNTLLIRLLFPGAAVGAAIFAAHKGWGLFNYINTPYPLAIISSVIIMDLVIYLQHVMFHALPSLWRLHRVHHADIDYDVTTGARFHPIEIIISMLIKFTTIVLLGAPAVAVIVFEILLNGTAMFNHSNVGLPRGVDRLLRWLVVTPDMHRIHHSVAYDEANSNFGFNLPWWDRLLGTYRAEARDEQSTMTIGITDYRTAKDTAWLSGMLLLPFKGSPGEYVINRRQM